MSSPDAETLKRYSDVLRRLTQWNPMVIDPEDIAACEAGADALATVASQAHTLSQLRAVLRKCGDVLHDEGIYPKLLAEVAAVIANAEAHPHPRSERGWEPRKLHMAVNIEIHRLGGKSPACDGPGCSVCAVLADPQARVT